MSSSELIDRKYYSLYIGNLSLDIRRKDLCQYLERFDRVDQCQIFEANHRRWTCFAFVLMRTPSAINRLMASRPHFLDNRRLYLKRALPEQCANKIEHFLTSANVLIRFRNAETEEIEEPNFNESNIRSYFQTYGTIVHLHLFRNNRCVIEFVDYDSVDCIILDSPHYFNSHELEIVKYYTPEEVKQIERMAIPKRDGPEPGAGEDEEQVEKFFRSRRHLTGRIRLLNDSILSIKISTEIQLETIHQGFLNTINRRKELLQRIEQLTEECRTFKEKNRRIEENNEHLREVNEQLKERYERELLDAQTQQQDWMDRLELLGKREIR